MKQIFLLFTILFFSSLHSDEEKSLYSFNSEEDHQRFVNLSKELRCPKCQSSSLSGSNSPISKDLKNQIQQLILEGKTDQEIKEYLLVRYGDYILYEPRFNSSTIVLWYGPFFILIMVLGALFFWNIRKNKDS